MRVVYNRHDLSFWIPVIFEVDEGSIIALGAYPENLTEEQQNQALIDAGLRAQLDLQSLVTGQLFINLDFHPEKPAQLIKAEVPKLHLPYPEIPTVKTPFQEISETLQDIQPQEIMRNIKETLSGLDRLVNSPRLHEGIAGLGEVIQDIRSLVRNVDAEIKVLARNADGTLSDARGLISRLEQTAEKTSRLVDDISDKVAPVAGTFKTVLDTAQASLDQARQTLRTIEVEVAQTDPLKYQLGEALTEITAAARSIRALADYIDRNPDALLKGRTPNGGR